MRDTQIGERAQHIAAGGRRQRAPCPLGRLGNLSGMGDIGRIAGHIPQADLAAYMQIAGSSVRLPFEKIDRILPTLRGLAAA